MNSNRISVILLSILILGCSNQKQDLSACQYDIYKTILLAGDRQHPHINQLGSDVQKNMILICIDSKGYEWSPTSPVKENSELVPDFYKRKYF